MSNTESNSIETPKSIRPYGSIPFIFVFGVAIGHCWWIGDTVSAASLVLVALGGFLGYYCGLWRTLASSVGMFAGYQLAVPTADRLVPFLQGQLNQSIEPKIGLAISSVVAGVVATLFLIIVGVFLRRNAFLKRCDQYTGFAFGLASTTATVALVFWVLLASEPDIERSRQIAQQNKAYGHASDNQSIAIERLSALVHAAKSSYLMVGLKSWNPFIDVAYFREMKAKIESSLAAARGLRASSDGSFGSALTPPFQGHD